MSRLKLLYLPKSKIITDDSLFEGFSDGCYVKEVRSEGLLSPPAVIKCGKSYRLINGFSDFAAAELSDLKRIPCIVLERADLVKLKAFFLSRELASDLHFFDAAEKISAFMEEFSLSREEAARLLCVEKRKINRLLLLLSLPPYLRLALRERGATESEALLCLKKSFVSERESEGPLPDARFKMAFDDYRIFKNTIMKTVKKINSAGINALSEFSEKENGLTCTIELKAEK